MTGIVGHVGLILGSSWNPAQLNVPPSFQYDDSTSVTDVSGAASTWSSKTGSAWDLLQSTAGNRPTINSSGLNSLRTLTFDGTADYMVTNNMTARAFTQNVANAWSFAVVKKAAVDGAGAFRVITSSNTGSSNTRLSANIGTTTGANKVSAVARRAAADGAGVLNGATSVGTGWRLVMLTMNYATRTATVYLDGVQDGQNTTITSAGSATENTIAGEQMSVGASLAASSVPGAFCDMELAALLGGRQGLPSTDERQKIEGWAAWRYGLTANLDVSHPYKSAPPTF